MITFKKFLIFLLAFNIHISGCITHKHSATRNDQAIELSKKAWREDLHALAVQLPRKHKNAFHTISRKQFDRAVAELDSSIPSLQNHEIAVGLMRIVAMIGDGHTGMPTPSSFSYYPIRFDWFGSELRVWQAVEAYKSALGKRLVRIGHTGIEDAFAKVNALIPQGESETYILSRSVHYLRYAEVLHALGIVADVKEATFTFKDAEGKQFALSMTPVAQDKEIKWIWACKQIPLFLQHFDKSLWEPLWFSVLPDSHTVYCNFQSYLDWDAMKKFCDELSSFINSHPIDRLVIDLRLNGGGDYFKGLKVMIPALKKCPAINRPGGIYVAIGRYTFSAAMSNAIHFRKYLNAILVGEPTGERPNGYAEGRRFILPNSHLSVSYSIRLYKFQDKDTRGVLPDKSIDLSWEYFQEGRDPVLEWILEQK